MVAEEGERFYGNVYYIFTYVLHLLIVSLQQNAKKETDMRPTANDVKISTLPS